MLMQKYGREFSQAAMENKGGCVSDRVRFIYTPYVLSYILSLLDHCYSIQVMAKLTFATPETSLVDAYLTEIARGYGLDWTPPLPPSTSKPEDPGDGDGNEGGGDEGLPVRFDVVSIAGLIHISPCYLLFPFR